MTFTKRQIARILDVSGKPLIAPGRMDHHTPARVAESFIRRHLFRWEDQAVIDQLGVYDRFYRQLRDVATQAAETRDVSKLGADGAGVLWLRDVMQWVRANVTALGDEVALRAYDAAMTAYIASYYGRMWLLSEMTAPDVAINTQPPDIERAGQRVLYPVLQEAGPFDPHQQLIYDLLGQEWRDSYGAQTNGIVFAVQRSLNGSLAMGESVPQAMRGVADVLGVNIDRRRGTAGSVARASYRANFNKVQTITRSYVIEASNAGAIDLYRNNADVLAGMEWLAANDGRVCPDCLALDGQTWAIDDLSAPRPVLDSHPNCRCSLIPVVVPDLSLALGSVDTGPRQSFTDFLGGLGVLDLLLNFLRDKRLGSDRVGDVWDYGDEEARQTI